MSRACDRFWLVGKDLPHEVIVPANAHNMPRASAKTQADTVSAGLLRVTDNKRRVPPSRSQTKLLRLMEACFAQWTHLKVPKENRKNMRPGHADFMP
eukprot:11290138-Karenia_brevis.AAC.1